MVAFLLFVLTNCPVEAQQHTGNRYHHRQKHDIA